MREFRDPAEPTRAATAALAAFWAADLLALGLPESADFGTFWEAAAIFIVIASIAGFVLVGRWFYRINANAHVLAEDMMTISPGWSIGWHFVPFANLVMPYKAMQEAWRASHCVAGLDGEAKSWLLDVWWGLWLVGNFLGAGSALMATLTPYDDVAFIMSSVVVLVDLLLCLVLVRLMRHVARAQALAHQVSAFS